jgi:hypothetical protein
MGQTAPRRISRGGHYPAGPPLDASRARSGFGLANSASGARRSTAQKSARREIQRNRFCSSVCASLFGRQTGKKLRLKGAHKLFEARKMGQANQS